MMGLDGRVSGGCVWGLLMAPQKLCTVQLLYARCALLNLKDSAQQLSRGLPFPGIGHP